MKTRYGTRPIRAPTKPKRRRITKSEWLALWAVVIGTLSFVAIIVLSAYDKQTASDYFTTVFATCVGYLVTYAGKSALEKSSRNKHGLDENGVPWGRENDNEGG